MVRTEVATEVDELRVPFAFEKALYERERFAIATSKAGATHAKLNGEFLFLLHDFDNSIPIKKYLFNTEGLLFEKG